jgi:hypothetical protein
MVALNVNGQVHQADVPPDVPFLTRDTAGLAKKTGSSQDRPRYDGINGERRRFLAGVSMTIAAAQLGLRGSAWAQSKPRTPSSGFATSAPRLTPAALGSTGGGEMPSLEGATAWLDSPALTAAGLRGKVVLIDFLTYTCINWLRSLPYVRAWASTYASQGLVVVGVHTPEFGFEHDLENVRREMGRLRVGFPVAVDSNYSIWRAFDNHYWPALYFVDARGRIRHHHFGEGEYGASEGVIRQLLTEGGAQGLPREAGAVEGRGVEAAADWSSLKSPENYLGYERTESFASPGGSVPDSRRTYATPARLKLNQWALAGDWTVRRDAVALGKANGRIVYRFHARDVHLVMGPAARGQSVQMRVRLDGQPPGEAHGLDVDEQGRGAVGEQRLHQLIRQRPPIAERQLEIEFLDPGVEAFAFTFG